MNPSRPQTTSRFSRKPKRFRSAFTTEQINYLEHQFKKLPYISSEHRKEIAIALNMQERAIKIWFQNRRMKEKKETCNKEDGIIKEEFDKDRLNNVCTLPSANSQLSYSLPVIMEQTIDRPTSIKSNTNSVQQNRNNAIPQNLSTSHLFPGIKYHLTSPFIQNKNLRYTADTLKMNIRKKEKIECHKHQVPKKRETEKPLISSILGAQEDVSSNKKPRTSQLHSKGKQAEAKGAAYFPVMPTVYAHPFISSGGMIWKPINVMPVMSAGTAMQSHSQESLGSGQNKSCYCQCHENGHTYAMAPNPINPYSQYVITPFPNSSPKF